MLIIIGLTLSLIWGMTTWISLGVPEKISHALNAGTFGLFEGVILKMQNGFYYDVANADMPTVVFLVLFTAAFALYLLSICFISRKSFHQGDLIKIIFFAVLFRIILMPSIAIHENDFYRYLWDGKVAKHGYNPFKYAPGDLKAAEYDFTEDYYDLDAERYVSMNEFSVQERRELTQLKQLRDHNPIFFDRIGHPQVPTIYPPMAQLIFWISSVLKEDSVLVMKTLFVLFDIMVIFVIITLLRALDRNPSMVIVYAWAPLVLKEFANSLHYDAVVVFFMMLAVYLLVRRKKTGTSFSFAAAGLAKFFPMLLLPLYVRELKWWRFFLIAGIFALSFLPFFLWNDAGVRQVFEGLFTYSQDWAYNGSIFVVIKAILKTFPIEVLHGLLPAKIACGVIFLGILGYLSFQKNTANLDLVHKPFIVLAALFLLNPVGDSWYFTWVIPFLCFFPYRSLLLLSWLLIFSYLSFAHDFGAIRAGSLEIPILNAIQYVPFFVVLIWEFILRKRNAMAY